MISIDTSVAGRIRLDAISHLWSCPTKRMLQTNLKTVPAGAWGTSSFIGKRAIERAECPWYSSSGVLPARSRRTTPQRTSRFSASLQRFCRERMSTVSTLTPSLRYFRWRPSTGTLSWRSRRKLSTTRERREY